MVRGIFTFLLIPPATAFFGTLALVGCFLVPQKHPLVQFGRLWSRLFLWTTGLKPRYQNLQFARPGFPVVFASNHCSIVDIWSLLPVLPLETKFVAKKSLFNIPIFGQAMRAGGFISMDRERLKNAIASLGRAAEQIRAGDSVLVFVEGTRSRDGNLRPFKKGAFRLAGEADVPIVPVAIKGTYGIFKPKSVCIYPREVVVTFHPPVHPLKAGQPISDWMNQVREPIAESLGVKDGTTTETDPLPQARSI